MRSACCSVLSDSVRLVLCQARQQPFSELIYFNAFVHVLMTNSAMEDVQTLEVRQPHLADATRPALSQDHTRGLKLHDALSSRPTMWPPSLFLSSTAVNHTQPIVAGLKKGCSKRDFDDTKCYKRPETCEVAKLRRSPSLTL
eukprot:6486605-Amphidinium_carterae.2